DLGSDGARRVGLRLEALAQLAEQAVRRLFPKESFVGALRLTAQLGNARLPDPIRLQVLRLARGEHLTRLGCDAELLVLRPTGVLLGTLDLALAEGCAVSVRRILLGRRADADVGARHDEARTLGLGDSLV